MSHSAHMRKSLAALHDGELDAAAREQLEEHISGCVACRETLREWEASDHLLCAARPQTAALAPDAAQAVFGRALQASGVERSGRIRYTRLRQFAWGLGLTCVMAAALFNTHRRAMDSLPVKIAIKPIPPHAVVSARQPTSDSRQQILATPSPHAVATSHSSHLRGQRAIYVAYHLAYHHARHHPRGATMAALLHNRRPHRDVAPARVVASPDDDIVLDVTDPPAQEPEPQSRLMVIVTHEPALDVEVTHAAEDAPGYAQAVCFRHGLNGAGIWEGCTIQNEQAGAEKVQTQVALILSGESPRLLEVQTTLPGIEKPDEPNTEVKPTEDKPIEDKTDQPNTEKKKIEDKPIEDKKEQTQ